MMIELKTERLVLKSLCINDLMSTHTYASNESNTIYMIHLPNHSLEETKSFLETVTKEWERDIPQFYEFAIWLENHHIGAISFYLNENRTIGKLGWILNKEYWHKGYAIYWHKGYAIESARRIVEFAKELKIKQLIAHCDDANIASYRVMEKLGMKCVEIKEARLNKNSLMTSKEHKYQLTLE